MRKGYIRGQDLNQMSERKSKNGNAIGYANLINLGGPVTEPKRKIEGELLSWSDTEGLDQAI
jgi:hypothetical protein